MFKLGLVVFGAAFAWYLTHGTEGGPNRYEIVALGVGAWLLAAPLRRLIFGSLNTTTPPRR